MIDHLGLTVSDLDRSKAFFVAALAPLSISLLVEVTSEQTGSYAHAGFGGDRPFFWIGGGAVTSTRVHAAFVAQSRAAVEAFYQAALNAGGRDNGAPGLRPYYHPNYFGAFVLDFDDNNIEAVCHRPE